jgi:hypothetical protein
MQQPFPSAGGTKLCLRVTGICEVAIAYVSYDVCRLGACGTLVSWWVIVPRVVVDACCHGNPMHQLGS